MKTRIVLLLAALLCLVPSSFAFQFKEEARARLEGYTAYGRLPLSFEANRGQAPEEVQFLSRGAGYFAFLNKSGALITLTRGNKHARVRMQLLHARGTPRITGLEMQRGRTNYLFADDPSRSLAGI